MQKSYMLETAWLSWAIVTCDLCAEIYSVASVCLNRFSVAMLPVMGTLTSVFLAVGSLVIKVADSTEEPEVTKLFQIVPALFFLPFII